jgi:2-(1,2-epoxy-1,2-dihydrophenyl)acetyl-CoA isomerase
MTATGGTEILTADVGKVRVVTLNRPERRNAIDMALRLALAEAVEEATADPVIRAIVITGAGSAFCSGGDVSTMRRQPPAEARPRAEAAQRVIRAIWSSPKPVIAAVEGAAYGAGASLALACDRVIAGEGALFTMVFTAVGLAGDMGIFASLPARIGTARARQLLMLPRPVPSPEGLQIGLVDRLVPDGTALGAAIEDASALAAGPSQALAVIKAMLSGAPLPPCQVLDEELEHQVRLFDSDDFAEGIAAFRDKRPAAFGTTDSRADIRSFRNRHDTTTGRAAGPDPLLPRR